MRPLLLEQRAREVVGVERAAGPRATRRSRSASRAGRAPLRSRARCRPSRCRRASSARCRVTSTVSWKSFAWRRPFWPVVASTVRSVSCGAPGICFSITRLTFASSSISGTCVWRRPAVSAITTSWPRACAASIASKTTAPGSEPGVAVTISHPARSAHCGELLLRRRAVGVGGRHDTDRPSSFWRCHAILPIVVVLPVPFTPTVRITEGSCETSMWSSPVARELGERLLQAARELLAALRARPPPPPARAARPPSRSCARRRPHRSASPRGAPRSRRRAAR